MMGLRRAALRRLARALYATLGWWLADAKPLVMKRKRASYFDLDPKALPLPRSEEEIEAEAWTKRHFRINGRTP